MAVSVPQAPMHFRKGTKELLQPGLSVLRGNSLLARIHHREKWKYWKGQNYTSCVPVHGLDPGASEVVSLNSNCICMQHFEKWLTSDSPCQTVCMQQSIYINIKYSSLMYIVQAIYSTLSPVFCKNTQNWTILSPSQLSITLLWTFSLIHAAVYRCLSAAYCCPRQILIILLLLFLFAC